MWEVMIQQKWRSKNVEKNPCITQCYCGCVLYYRRSRKSASWDKVDRCCVSGLQSAAICICLPELEKRDMSGYIMELRKLVGHRTLIQCAASIIVINEKGQILLGKRTDNHLWGYSGGSLEIDEKVEECAVRELKEEMGLIADELEFFMVNSGKEVHYIYPNGDEVSNIEIIYLCRKYHGEICRQEEEMEELRFFDPQEIELSMISPPIRPVVKALVEKMKS